MVCMSQGVTAFGWSRQRGVSAVSGSGSLVLFFVIAAGIFTAFVVVAMAWKLGMLLRSTREREGPAPLIAPPGPVPGWYPDRTDPRLLRYFDGRSWTSWTALRE